MGSSGQDFSEPPGLRLQSSPTHWVGIRSGRHESYESGHFIHFLTSFFGIEGKNNRSHRNQKARATFDTNEHS